MASTRMIPIPMETLNELELHVGDSLHVLAVADGAFIVRIVSREEGSPVAGSAREWVKSARGAVRLAEGETPDDVRMEYYAEKFNLAR